MNRRKFLQAAAITCAAVTLNIGDDLLAESINNIPKRKLGKTGEMLSIIGFGGIVVMNTEQAEANKMVTEAIDAGINYFDVAPSYGNAEERLGPALKPYRDKVFLACKTGKRDAKGAQEELVNSLKRLDTDHFDLYQLHGFMSVEDVDQAFAKGGAIETFITAKEKGIIKNIGFSAHTVDSALSAIKRFDFDTVLFPLNFACIIKGNFGHQVIEEAQKKKMGILALKTMAKGPLPDGTERKYPKCWYEPLTDKKEIELAIRYTLSLPITAALPPGHDNFLKAAIEVAKKYKPLNKSEIAEIEKLANLATPLFRNV